MMRFLNSLFMFTLVLNGCNAQKPAPQAPVVSDPQAFTKYWYTGVAELNSYDLVQYRYGETHRGEVVLVYVTEDFLIDKQVKKELGNSPFVSALKLNMMKKFITGIYDYSIMSSVFTPIMERETGNTLKITFSSQDWCGQSFSQMNLRDGIQHFETRSYFQEPGDETVELPRTNTEEEVWTRMRLEPQTLPMGKFEMVPSQECLRLYHLPLKPYKAEARLLLQIGEGGKEHYVYQLGFPELSRTVVWECENKFPFKVLGWEETHSIDGKTAKTIATLRTTLIKPYWELNQNKNAAERDSLQLRYKIE